MTTGYNPSMPKLGLFDTQDNCWIGNNDGPLTYDDMPTPSGQVMPAQTVAQLAAQLLCMRMKWSPTRIRPKPLDCPNPVKKDDIKPERSADEAMQRLLDGHLS